MKRLVLVLVPLALVFSACAVPVIKPPTYVSDKGAVFNGNVYSNLDGDAEYWWSISFENGGGGTSSHTVRLVAGQPGAVSTPFNILDPSTTYHLTMCAQDHEQNPPRQVCSKPTDFRTPPAGGRSGIAFMRRGEIYLSNPDGSGKTNLTQHAGNDYQPTWSADATKIAFMSDRDGRAEIYSMNADGSNQVRLTNTCSCGEPAWSPDGTKIAFMSSRAASPQIWVMNANGTNPVQLTTGDSVDAQYLSWSPDGGRIAYTGLVGSERKQQIVVMNADGSDPHSISGDEASDSQPMFSPDGTTIAFRKITNKLPEASSIFRMNSDGSDRLQLTTGPLTVRDALPTFSPDGGQIAFWRDNNITQGPDQNDNIFRMDARGAGVTNISQPGGTGGDAYPAWSRRP